ncbi:dTDP-4-dehydrorhamnose 3,5-epimerase [Saprospira grandis DSM 2844]|uniref:dTDP-4-dehydrorhamnose 3,5-epimerase n=1 Tax=Saprospira grandis DSM 2844 TaxID=694433 RepID=J1I6X3_9BACT|nr:dTDP-4-dehydrorhamnose 3,5-epimerase [Saprospira grandis]EJF54138.1 dTDP-4-dehydrorhamnose 3,5-epimerase [Saprospira grandis DSM 2844]
MPFVKTPIADLLLFEPRVFEDDRGYFFEAFNAQTFAEAGIERPFVQDNQARSAYGVLRGLHYQVGEQAQAKLVRVLEGKVLDVVVDLRPDSPTYGEHYGVELSAENKRQLYVPRGFAHGYVVLSKTAEFFYKCDNFYHKASEGGIRYDDPQLNIDWQIDLAQAILSEKDLELPHFGQQRKA